MKMKTFIIFALCVAASAADPINHLALERMFQDLLGLKPESKPIFVGPATVVSDPDDTKIARNAPIQIYVNVNSGSQVWTGVSIARSSAVDAEYEPISDGPTFMDSAPDTPVRIFVNVNSGSQVWNSVSVGTATEHEPIFTEVINTPEIQIFTNVNTGSQVWQSALQSLLSLTPNLSLPSPSPSVVSV